jgi:hypothetical protein
VKVLINDDWGGFSVSEAVYKELGYKWDTFGYLYGTPLANKYDDSDLLRADADLIEAVERVGLEKASGPLANLAIVDIPDGMDWYIHNCDGRETVREKHRSCG